MGFLKTGKNIVRNGGGFAFFSALQLIEGVVHFATPDAAGAKQAINPDALKASFDREGKLFPPVLTLIGGVFEIFLGVYGIMIAAIALTERKSSTLLTRSFILFQVCFGLYFFAVFPLAKPTFVADRLDPLHTVIDDPTVRRGIYALDTVAAAILCGYLQAAVTFFAWALDRGVSDIKYKASYYRIRLMVYCFFLMIVAACILSVGGIHYALEGPGRIGLFPWFFPPLGVLYPDLLIASGVITLVLSTFGFATGFIKSEKVFRIYAGLNYFNFVYNLGTIVLVPVTALSIPDGAMIICILFLALHGSISYQAIMSART